MKISKILLIIVSWIPTIVIAENNFYLGLDYGLSSIDSDVSSVSGADLDEDDSGFKLYGGFKATKKISLKFHYADFGKGSLSGNADDRFVLDGIPYEFIVDNASIELESTSLGLSGIFIMSASDKVYPYGRVGVHRWDIDGKADSDLGTDAFNDDGTNILLGIGIQSSINKNIYIRGEYEYFKFENDLDYISLGLVFYL